MAQISVLCQPKTKKNNNNNNNNLISILRKIHVSMIKCALHESNNIDNNKLSKITKNII